MPQEYFLELYRARVSPADRPWETGIPSKDGRTLPFRVERAWSGPAGNYLEQWSLRKTVSEAIYTSEPRQIQVRGMQSISEYTDEATTPIEVGPGTYLLVFVVEGLFMGSVEVEVNSAGDAAA